jgi:CheY-like chemotaxis protein
MTRKRRILLVDDDQDLVQATRLLLENEGYEVGVAYDGKSGVEAAKKTRPDLVILDVMMATKTDGFEASRQLVKIPELRDLPVILVTGVAKAMRLRHKVEPDETWLPVKAVLDKPVAPEKLLREIARNLPAA